LMLSLGYPARGTAAFQAQKPRSASMTCRLRPRPFVEAGLQPSFPDSGGSALADSRFRRAVLADRPGSREGQPVERGSIPMRIGGSPYVLGARRDGLLDTTHRGFRRAPRGRGRRRAVSDGRHALAVGERVALLRAGLHQRVASGRQTRLLEGDRDVGHRTVCAGPHWRESSPGDHRPMGGRQV
jgi:hypothetical protein